MHRQLSAPLPARGGLPMPAPSARLARPGTLAQELADGLSGFAEGPARAQARLPAVVAQAFAGDALGLPNYYGAQALAFATLCAARAQAQPRTAAFLARFSNMLRDAAHMTVWLSRAGPHADRVGRVVDAFVIDRLRAHQPFIMQAGFSNPGGDAHACSLVLVPHGVDAYACAVIDRGRDPDDPLTDVRGRPQAEVMRLDAAKLRGPLARAHWVALARLQGNDPQAHHSLDDFHAGVAALYEACDGHMLLGHDPRGRPRRRLPLCGQSAQKGDTCVMHALFGALHFAVHAWCGGLDPTRTAATQSAAHHTYRHIKQLCRRAILEQALAAGAAAASDAVWAASLNIALAHVHAYLTARAGLPGKDAAELLALFAPDGAPPLKTA